MSARMDRSLVLAWGVGLALCAVGAVVTRAVVSARTAEARVVAAAGDTMHGLPVREAWDQTVRGEGGSAAAATGEVSGEGMLPPAATGEVRGESAGARGESG